MPTETSLPVRHLLVLGAMSPGSDACYSLLTVSIRTGLEARETRRILDRLVEDRLVTSAGADERQTFTVTRHGADAFRVAA